MMHETQPKPLQKCRFSYTSFTNELGQCNTNILQKIDKFLWLNFSEKRSDRSDEYNQSMSDLIV